MARKSNPAPASGATPQLDLDYAATASDDVTNRPATKEERRAALQAELARGELNKIQSKVAWVLNNFPETRDSDIHLQLRYWETFEGFSGDVISRDDLFRLPRLTTLARARANIQNDLRLFQASPEVRHQRGKLSEEERQRLAEQAPPAPLIAIYADESGKTGDHLIWGSVWYLHAADQLKVIRKAGDLQSTTGLKGELHFKAIDKDNLPSYVKAVDFLLRELPAVSFKAITLRRLGLPRADEALQKALYHLLVRGLRHEHDTGRAVLPRSMGLVKDEEDQSRDSLMLATIRDQVQQAAKTTFENQLRVDEFMALASHDSIHLQLADLFASSLNRVLNSPNSGSAKDEFARFFLSRVGAAAGSGTAEAAGDLSVVLNI